MWRGGGGATGGKPRGAPSPSCSLCLKTNRTVAAPSATPPTGCHPRGCYGVGGAQRGRHTVVPRVMTVRGRSHGRGESRHSGGRGCRPGGQGVVGAPPAPPLGDTHGSAASTSLRGFPGNGGSRWQQPWHRTTRGCAWSSCRRWRSRHRRRCSTSPGYGAALGWPRGLPHGSLGLAQLGFDLRHVPTGGCSVGRGDLHPCRS